MLHLLASVRQGMILALAGGYCLLAVALVLRAWPLRYPAFCVYVGVQAVYGLAWLVTKPPHQDLVESGLLALKLAVVLEACWAATRRAGRPIGLWVALTLAGGAAAGLVALIEPAGSALWRLEWVRHQVHAGLMAALLVLVAFLRRRAAVSRRDQWHVRCLAVHMAGYACFQFFDYAIAARRGRSAWLLYYFQGIGFRTVMLWCILLWLWMRVPLVGGSVGAVRRRWRRIFRCWRLGMFRVVRSCRLGALLLRHRDSPSPNA